jgi:hypothetical protein
MYKQILKLAAVLLIASACVPQYTVHPGAINKADSAAYDALLIAQAAIDQSRSALEAGELPASLRATLNAVVASYNIARESWLAFRGSPDTYPLTTLNKNITDLMNAIRDLTKEAPDEH